MAKRYELEAAYYQGLREMNGMDDDVARDLGFVTSPEEFEATLESHKPLNQPTSAEIARAEASAYYTSEFHLTGPIELSPEEKDRNNIAIAGIRANLKAEKERRGQ